MDIASVNLTAGWLGILAGVVSGCAIGLFFHRADWLGGYASFRRRMTRLGHISFFGLGCWRRPKIDPPLRVVPIEN